MSWDIDRLYAEKERINTQIGLLDTEIRNLYDIMNTYDGRQRWSRDAKTARHRREVKTTALRRNSMRKSIIVLAALLFAFVSMVASTIGVQAAPAVATTPAVPISSTSFKITTRPGFDVTLTGVNNATIKVYAPATDNYIHALDGSPILVYGGTSWLELSGTNIKYQAPYGMTAKGSLLMEATSIVLMPFNGDSVTNFTLLWNNQTINTISDNGHTYTMPVVMKVAFVSRVTTSILRNNVRVWQLVNKYNVTYSDTRVKIETIASNLTWVKPPSKGSVYIISQKVEGRIFQTRISCMSTYHYWWYANIGPVSQK